MMVGMQWETNNLLPTCIYTLSFMSLTFSYAHYFVYSNTKPNMGGPPKKVPIRESGKRRYSMYENQLLSLVLSYTITSDWQKVT